VLALLNIIRRAFGHYFWVTYDMNSAISLSGLKQFKDLLSFFDSFRNDCYDSNHHDALNGNGIVLKVWSVFYTVLQHNVSLLSFATERSIVVSAEIVF
jgi:hypothetical protein